MSTSTRTLANRVRTALGWIDAHADLLPGGWTLNAYPHGAGVGLTWIDSDMATVEQITHLMGDAEPHPDGNIWTWRAEGDRPRLDVYTETPPAVPTAPPRGAGVEGPGEAGRATPTPPARPVYTDYECCASGRCEVCEPGAGWSA